MQALPAKFGPIISISRGVYRMHQEPRLVGTGTLAAVRKSFANSHSRDARSDLKDARAPRGLGDRSRCSARSFAILGAKTICYITYSPSNIVDQQRLAFCRL